MSETSAAAEEPVVVRERHGKVEVVRINRERARNAIDGPTALALSSTFDELEEDSGVWAVIITGTGERAFCAGMDLKAFASGQMGDILGAKGGFGGLSHREFPKPLIAAVNGAALAGGFELVLSCDLVVAADHATFGVPEVKRGLVAAGGGVIRLAKRTHYAVALELILTGDPVDAARAYELGLVNKVVPAAEVMQAALALAERICENAPLSVRESKRVARRSLDLTEADAWTLNTEATAKVFSHPDAMEGAISFAEKRSPVWSGD